MPPDMVRHDADDAYLLVAADKGTAHLSDSANRVSAQYGFWLGDAFASGRSNGYDHKKEGITARGAWECVRHHFRNLGTDVQTEPFTMAAVGDLSGDVFGNGVLRSRTTRLVAAFNHQHIFLDPDPDPATSFAERERMFNLPRSTWRDYDTSRISAGGGVFDRAAKTIPLGPEVRRLLDLDQAEAIGEDVVRAILRARVDLFYNGGIGTYVKASAEDHADVGDPPTTAYAWTPASSGRASWRRAATCASPSARASSTGTGAASSTPTPWTTPAAWTCRTTR